MPDSVPWEVLVVDNNSTDQTREVVEDFRRRHGGRFRYLFESTPGKSYALNAGIRESHGNVLAFMDDDVVVEPPWLDRLTNALQDKYWAGTGGRILPAWTGKPPRWIPLKERYALAPLAMFDLGLQAGPLSEAPFGTNMAFHKSLFEKYGGFRTDLGPRPGSEIRNEDTEFGNRLLAAGERLRYEPLAVVHHAVSDTRTQKQYFLRWWFDKARADIRELGVPTGTKWFIAGIPLYLFRRLTIWALRWMVAIQPARRFSCKLKVWGRMGEIQECYRIAHQNDSRSCGM
jgi:glycosyltransferase involved in cell wall biosynthesis